MPYDRIPEASDLRLLHAHSLELTTRHLRLAQTLSIGGAVAMPVLLAVNWPPSPTLVNQALALSAWGLVAVFASGAVTGKWLNGRAAIVLLAAITVAIACAVASSAVGALPLGVGLAAAAVMGAAGVMAYLGSVLAAQHAQTVVKAFLWTLLLAGLASCVVALVQVFAPAWADGDWIARATPPPVRAGANLRQPNHLSSLLLWSLIALIGLREWLGWRPVWTPVALPLLCLGLVLTGSRTGVLGVLILATWGLLDPRLSRASRAALLVLPLVYAALWFGVTTWSHATGHGVGAEGRVSLGGDGDISSSRFAIWSNTIAMIAQQPWLGVGFGEFNVAWTLTAFPARPTAFFDHTHNLPLHMLVELGIPLGLLVIGLLLVALVQAGKRAWGCDGALGAAKRAAFMVVLMIGLHSMLEYPLWYAYFLLPAAFAWGFALAGPESSNGAADDTPEAGLAKSHRLSRTLAWAGFTISAVAAAAVLDYRRVVAIYDPPDNAAALEQRIALGQRSPLFGHHADYAAATAFGPPKAPLSPSQELAFRRAPHQLLDVRLMIAWSQALAAQGDLDKARWLAARIREFRNPGADEYFAPCQDAAQAAQAFQCQAPTREVRWREFIER